MRHLALLLGLSTLLFAGEIAAQQPPAASSAPAAPSAAPAGQPPGQPPPPAAGQPPPPGYGQPPPGYPPGYPPPGYGYPPPGYGYPPPPGYGPPPGYYYPPPGEPPETKKRNSTGLMVGGIISTSVGAILVGVGAVLFVDADQRQFEDCLCADNGTPCGCGSEASSTDDRKTAAAAVMVVGGVLTAAGIPMIIVGARKVPIDPAEDKASLEPELRVSTSRVALRWSF